MYLSKISYVVAEKHTRQKTGDKNAAIHTRESKEITKPADLL